MLKSSITIFLLTLFNACFSQDPEMDSLRKIAYSGAEPEKRAGAIIDMCQLVSPDDAPEFINLGFKVLDEEKFKNRAKHDDFRAKLEENLGVYLAFIGNQDSAIYYYRRVLPYYFKTMQPIRAGYTYYNLANSYERKGEISKCLNCAFKSLDAFVYAKDLTGQSWAFNMIGLAYLNLGLEDKTLEYQMKCFRIDSIRGDEYDLALDYNNLGALYSDRHEYDSAIYYYHLSLPYYLETSDTEGLVMTYTNLGNSLAYSFQYDSAQHCFDMAAELVETTRDMEWQARILECLARLRYFQERFDEGFDYAISAHNLSLEINYPVLIASTATIASQNAEKLGNYRAAFELIELSRNLHDSLSNAKTRTASIQKEIHHDYEIRKVADSLDFENRAKMSEVENQANLDFERNRRYGLYLVVACLAILGGLAFINFRRKKRDHELIAAQKKLVDEKNEEITDSINYARRIQEAILPSESQVKALLNEHFVIYLPKDIVAGDFYWLDEKSDNVLVAVADCTGHGVPGAMVSVVCHNALYRAIHEYELDQPNLILDKTRDLVIQTLAKNSEVKDGMDIALCRIDRKKKEILFSGANNNIYVVSGDELKEIKADKQPVGLYSDAKPFTSQRFNYGSGEALYIFSDGFADQFGGADGKKLKYKPFKQKLVELSHLPMTEQGEELSKFFSKWKGSYEQLDDVCIIGVRL